MTKETIKNAIYTFGCLPALICLKEQEENENYELCAIIKQALDEVSKGREWYLSTKTEDIQKVFDNELKMSSNKINFINNMPHWVDRFKLSAEIK